MEVNCRKWWSAIALVMMVGAPTVVQAEWQRFRGPNGMGIDLNAELPQTWSDEQNIQWKIKLPGPGTSSPVVNGNEVYVTAYSGYGISSDEGSVTDLKRHLLCIDRQSGEVRWTVTVDSVPEEDPYSRQLGEHGYATQTPVTDGQRIYAFFGKSGVFAFDLTGKQLWHTDVGRSSGERKWGSACSPILYNGNVIVTASDESLAIYSLNGETGEEIWKVESSKFANTYCTPVSVNVDNRQELIVLVPNEIWGLDPATGECTWYAHINLKNTASASVVAHDGIVYVTGGDSLAIKAGGKGDVTESHILWTAKGGSGMPSPVLFGDYLYYVNGQGKACCVDAKTGKEVYSEDLEVGRGGFYSSLALGGDKLYAVSRTKGCYVLEVGPTFELLAHNTFAGDESQFNSCPAISDNQLFIRSNEYLYCIANTAQTVAKAEN